jgi:hypothetical protein
MWHILRSGVLQSVHLAVQKGHSISLAVLLLDKSQRTARHAQRVIKTDLRP